MADAVARMGDKAVPALFITVEPGTGHAQVMQDYAAASAPPSSASRAAAGDRRAERPIGCSPAGRAHLTESYAMDHSSLVYLMDKSGGFVERSTSTRAEEVAREIGPLSLTWPPAIRAVCRTSVFLLEPDP